MGSVNVASDIRLRLAKSKSEKRSQRSIEMGMKCPRHLVLFGIEGQTLCYFSKTIDLLSRDWSPKFATHKSLF